MTQSVIVVLCPMHIFEKSWTKFVFLMTLCCYLTQCSVFMIGGGIVMGFSLVFSLAAEEVQNKLKV